MRTKLNFFILLGIFVTLLFNEPIVAATPNKIKFGTELDALPYLSGGYYGSFVVGYQNYRIRGILTHTFPPDFVTPDGFANYELQVYAVILDYFFGEKGRNLEGFWLGSGIEFWETTVTNKNDLKNGNFKNTIFTLGGGYVWRFYKNLYLNPWLAGHLRIGGPAKPRVGNSQFEVPIFTPEASLKIGFYF